MLGLFSTLKIIFKNQIKFEFLSQFPRSRRGAVFPPSHARSCMYGHACSSPRRSVFSGGAKARMTEVEGVRLPSVVRRLRTTGCKRTRSNSTVCAFALPKKIREISKAASPWVT